MALMDLVLSGKGLFTPNFFKKLRQRLSKLVFLNMVVWGLVAMRSLNGVQEFSAVY